MRGSRSPTRSIVKKESKNVCTGAARIPHKPTRLKDDNGSWFHRSRKPVALAGSPTTPGQRYDLRFHIPYRRDDVKRKIARPTYWFVKNVLKLRAFVGEVDTTAGADVDAALFYPAYECTHALVILSPKFREHRYCVKELNTFMERRSKNGGCVVLPALYLLTNLEGYVDELSSIIWLSNGSSGAVDYMVLDLWPRLHRHFCQTTPT